MIPPYEHNHVLPPYIGDPHNRFNYSPYRCDVMEFCQHFCTSPERIELAKSFMDFRLACVANGITGRQWVDGSFVEDTEAQDNRKEPECMIVTSLIEVKTQEEADWILKNFPEFTNPLLSMEKYKVDHYVFVVNQSPDEIISWTKFWVQLFSHNELGVWKGMIELPLYDNDANDQMARSFLNSL